MRVELSKPCMGIKKSHHVTKMFYKLQILRGLN